MRVPQVQRKRRRLGHGEDGRIRHRAERPDHAWSDYFIHDQTADGRGLELLPVIDEFTRECLAIEVEWGLTAEGVVSTLEYLFEVRGEPEFIRDDNGPEFIAEAVRGWTGRRGAKAPNIAPGSPREDAYSETFNSRLREELLDREVFETLVEAEVIVEDHRLGYNHRRPHSSLGCRAPAEFAAAWIKPGVASLPPGRAHADPHPRALIATGPESGGRSLGAKPFDMGLQVGRREGHVVCVLVTRPPTDFRPKSAIRPDDWPDVARISHALDRNRGGSPALVRESLRQRALQAE